LFHLIWNLVETILKNNNTLA